MCTNEITNRGILLNFPLKILFTVILNLLLIHCLRYSIYLDLIYMNGKKVQNLTQRTCKHCAIDQLQVVMDRVYAPHNIEQALHHILNPNAIGSTVITFQ